MAMIVACVNWPIGVTGMTLISRSLASSVTFYCPDFNVFIIRDNVRHLPIYCIALFSLLPYVII